MKCSLGISNFLEEIASLSHSIFPLYFFGLFTEECFLIFLAILGTLHSNEYIFPFLLFLSLLFIFTAICKASSGNHFTFLHFFFLGMVLITASCTMSWISVHSFFRHSIRSNPLNLFVISRSYMNGLVVFPTFFNLPLNLAIRSS